MAYQSDFTKKVVGENKNNSYQSDFTNRVLSGAKKTTEKTETKKKKNLLEDETKSSFSEVANSSIEKRNKFKQWAVENPEEYKKKIEEQNKWYNNIIDTTALENISSVSDIPGVILGTGVDIVKNAAAGATNYVYNQGMNGVQKVAILADIVGTGRELVERNGIKGALDFLGNQNISFSDKMEALKQISPGYYDAFLDIEANNQDIAVVSDIRNAINSWAKDESTNSLLGSFTQDAVMSAGDSATSQVVSKIGGSSAFWIDYAFETAFRNELTSAKQQGYSTDEAMLSAIASGAGEVVSEFIFQGLIKLPGTGSGIETALGQLTEKISNDALRTLAQMGIETFGEGAEEVISGLISRTAQKLTYLSEDDWSNFVEKKGDVWEFKEGGLDTLLKNIGGVGEGIGEYWNSGELAQDFTAGSISSLAGMGNPQTIKEIKQGKNLITGLTHEESQLVENEKQLLKDISQKRVEEASKDKTLSNEEIKAIEKETKQMYENGGLSDYIETKSFKEAKEVDKSNNEIKSKIDEIDTKIESLDKRIKTAEDSNYRTLSKEQTSELINESKQLLDEKSKLQNELRQGLTNYNELLNKSREEFRVNSQIYENFGKNYQKMYDKSTPFTNENHKAVQGEKASQVYESISKTNARNTDEMHKVADYTAEFAEKTNKNVVWFDENTLPEKYKRTDGLYANGFVDGDTIYLNVNSTQAHKVVLGHELTHMLEITKNEYGSFQEAILKYAETNMKEEFDKLKESYSKMYSAEELNNELTSQLSGELLFNEQFMESLTGKPSLIKSIMNKIDELITKISGTQAEKDLLELKKQYKALYDKSIQKNSEGIKFSKISNNKKIYEKYPLGTKINSSNYEELKISPKYIDNNGNLDYNMIPEQLHKEIIKDERKAKYLEYSTLEKFYEISLENMDKVIKLASGQASIEYSNGEIIGALNYENYLFYYNIYENGNFGINDYIVYNKDDVEVSNEAIENGIIEGNINESTNEIKTKSSNWYNSTIENGIPNKNDVGMGEKTKNNNIITSNEKIFGNKQELENSSFSLDKNNIKNNIKTLQEKINDINTIDELQDAFNEIDGLVFEIKDQNASETIDEKDGKYGISVKIDDTIYPPNYKYTKEELIKSQKEVLKDRLDSVTDENIDEYLYKQKPINNPEIGKTIDSLNEVKPITNDEFKQELSNKIDEDTKDISGDYSDNNGHLYRDGKEVKYLYRAINQDELDFIKENGYIQSNQSMNLGYEVENNYTVYKDTNPKWYLPRNADGYILKIEINPENGFFYDTDEYAKTSQKIPSSQIVEVNGEKISQNNNKVKYSLSDDGELQDQNGNKVTLETSDTGTTGTLMAIHNLSEDKLKGILELGGFPVPSIAITNPNLVNHSEFGNISVLFDKQTINPEIKENEVYDRDVWSPTFPQVDYNMDSTKLNAIADKLGIRSYNLEDYADNNKTPEYLSDRLTRVEEIVDKYIKDNNIEYETAYKNAETRVALNDKENIKEFIKKNDFDVYKLVNDEKLRNEYFNLIRENYTKSFIAKVGEEKISQINDFIESQKGSGDNGIVRTLQRYQDDFDMIKSGEKQVVDEWQTNKNKKDAAINNGLKEYLKEQTKPLFTEKGIYNGKDYLTPSGNRRSFWQLHDEYNLENIVNNLTSKDTKGTQNWLAGYGQIQAQMANRFNSIEDIKQNESKLVNLSEQNEKLTELRDNIESDIDEIYNDNDVEMWTISELFADFAKGSLTIDNFRKLNNKYYQTIKGVSNEQINKIIDDLNALKDMPTDYFEAKPQRAVGLDEIQQVVIPNNTSEEFKKQLQDMGIQYTEYDSSIEGDRQRVINQFDDLKFSLSEEAPTKDYVKQLSDMESQISELNNRIKTLNEDIGLNRVFNRLDAFKQLDSENRQYLEEYRQSLENLEAPYYNPEEDVDDISYNKNNLIQYENIPGFKELLDNEIKGVIGDIENTLRGERVYVDKNEKGKGSSGKYEILGIKRQTASDMDKLIDGYGYDSLDAAIRYIRNDGKSPKTGRVLKRVPYGVNAIKNLAYQRLVEGYTDTWGNEWQPSMEFNSLVRNYYANEGYEAPTEYDGYNPYEEELPSPTRLKVNESEQYLPNKVEKYTPTTYEVKQIEENLSKIEETIKELPRDAAVEFLSNIQRDVEKSTNKKVNNEKVKTMVSTLKEAFVNSNEYIDKFSKDSGNAQIKYKADLWNNAFNTANYNNEVAQTDLNGNKIGKSINDLFSEAKKSNLYEAFNDYLFQLSNIERHQVGKGSIVPLATSELLAAEYEKSYPQFKEWQTDVSNYFDNLLKNELEAGLIDQTAYDLLRGEKGIYRSYVPFFSADVDESRYFNDRGEAKPVYPLKSSKGYAHDIMRIEDAIKKQSMAVWNSIRQNQLHQEIIKTLGGNEIWTDRPVYDMDNSLYEDDGKFYATAIVDGKEVTANISQDMYNELTKKADNYIKNLEEKFSPVFNPLQKATNLRRNLLTSWNPLFTLYKNPVKDLQDAIYYSKHTGDMLKNYPSAFKELATKNTQEVNQFLALFGGSEFRDTKNSKFKLKTAYDNLSEIIELAPRYAEYKASLQNGSTIEEALYNAHDITTNFGRGGYVTKALNRNGFTFLNASVQGFDKFIRNFSEQPNAKAIAMTLGKAALLGMIPALFNDLVFGVGDDKDEEYEALPNYIKDNYYLIKMGDKFIKIPKGRVLSVIGSAARRTLESAETGENQFDGYLNNSWTQIGVDDIGGKGLFAPIRQAFGSENGEAWYGGDIVPTRLQNVPDSEQTDSSIDAISNFIGEKTGLSPYKVNYVLEQYGGNLVKNFVLNPLKEETTTGADSILDYAIAPIKSEVEVNPIMKNKYPGEFYTKLDELKVATNGSNPSEEDVLGYKYLSSVSSEMSQLYKEKREVQESDLSKAEKYEKVQEIQKQINELAKEGLDTYKDIKVNGNYAEVNGKTYKQDSEGNWTKPSESDEEDVNTLGLTDSEKSTYYETSSKLTSINSTYTKEKKNKSESEKEVLSKKQKQEMVNEISNSKNSNEVKYALYNKYYGSEKSSNYLMDSNIDFNTYANATIEIDNIKNQYANTDDMTSKQKTAQGKIRKSQVQQYINSLDLDMEQKMMLEHYLGGYSVKDYKKYIEPYIDNLNITQSEKEELWNSLFK